MTDDARRTSFDRNAALYDDVRPGYPPAVIDELRAHVAGTHVLEVGAGTGKATELLARSGYTVTAVEPGVQLCAILRAKALPDVQVVQARFEDLHPHDFDLVLAAQSWHWMAADRFERAAAAAPVLVILRNEKAPIDRALRAELDVAYDHHLPAGAKPPHDEVPGARADYTRSIIDSGLYRPPYVAELPWTERYPTARYLQLLATYSDHAVLPAATRDALFAEIAAAIDRRGGMIEVPYVTLVFIAHRLG